MCQRSRADDIAAVVLDCTTLQTGPLRGAGYDVRRRFVLNSRGRPETRFKQRTKLGRLAYKIGGKWRGLPEKFKYCVYPSLSEVPPSAWSNPKLMVERFIPARLAPPITKHRFDFFYEVGLNARSIFNSLLCEPKTVMHVDSVSDIPDEVIAVRRALNLDYGAIDYFVTKDEVCVIDANKTVGVTSSWIEQFPLVARHVEAVADRLIEFVRGS